MNNPLRMLLPLLVLSTLLAGCPKPADMSPVVPDITGVAPAVDYRDLGAVLQNAVKQDGLLNASALRENSGTLDNQLKLLAVTGPTATPALLRTDDDRLAYWFNARTAWAIKLVLLCDCPLKVEHMEMLHDRQFQLDGRRMTLRQIDALLAADADWRTLAAAPCACFDRAGLPDKPFTAKDIRSQIPERFNDFVGDQRRFVIDVEHKRVLVPMVIWNMRDKLIGMYETTYGARGVNLLTALLPYLHGVSELRLRDATGYAIEPRQPSGLIARLKHDW